MDDIDISTNGTSFAINGFPDVVKALKLTGPKAQRLADLFLHKKDLEVALKSLSAINSTPDEPHLLREALWQMAVILFFKCFGQSGSRFSLSYEKIYGRDEAAKRAFEYFKSIRNKTIIHDENSYTQSVPCALLNNEGAERKIAKIVSISMTCVTLDQSNYNNMFLLATQAQAWVIEQFDGIANELASDLERKNYSELLTMDDLIITTPSIHEVHKSRNRS